MSNLPAFLIIQLLAHVVSDFYLQSQKWSDGKSLGGFKSRYLYYHILATFVCSSLFAFRLDWILYALGIALVHLIIDGVKSILEKAELLGEFRNWLFFVDQGLHVMTIVGALCLYGIYGGSVSADYWGVAAEALAILLAYSLCLKPANIVIRETLRAYKIEMPGDDDTSLPGAGRLIGIVERLLALTLILAGQFSAVGFIFAAKSILRFKDAEGERAEYVLAGSLLSFGIAVLIGILAK
ncbi:DUF3307 domain-containing protein [Puniceicoccaceae bacterium K14]|nr:DUF3307 domain-containing protein [Puniceicoccaceae bacterium K14]